MTLFETDLGDASSWCDSACDRCPLLPSCRVGQVLARRTEQRQQEDDPEVLMADLTRDLNRALVMLEEACDEEGVVLGTEPVPIPALVVRAERLSTALAQAAADLTEAAVQARRIDEAASARLLGTATLIAVKVVRVAWELGDEGCPADLAATVEPVLLLLERASAEMRRDALALARFVPGPVVARFTAAHGGVIDLITPWIAAISPASRAELRARIAAGCAPSPFCRRGSPAGAPT